MAKHTLFMLNPWIEADGLGPYYCPDCGVVEGFLAYSPEIRNHLEIVFVDFKRPRDEIVKYLGLEHQNSPVLVLNEEQQIHEGALQSQSTGKYFIDDAMQICNFLSETYNGVTPHP